MELDEDMKELLDMPKKKFIETCLAWIEEENEGNMFSCALEHCPLAIWVAHNNAKCHRESVPNTDVCPLCGNAMCPECGNHVVGQLSRVTGYIQLVSGWNEAKKQEFLDRTRYDV